MSRKTNRTIGMLAAMLVAATPAPSLANDDLRSQDALDSARSLPPEQLVAVSEGLRKDEDALDAARSLPPEQLVAVSEGLRSPASVGESDGFDWPSAMIGAAGLLGLIGMSLTILLGVRQIRRPPVRGLGPHDDIARRVRA
jgi:hypothetical protein